MVEKKFTRLQACDYDLIVTWLEIPGNKEKIQGGGDRKAKIEDGTEQESEGGDDSQKRTRFGARPLSKIKAYGQMASFLNEHQRKGSTNITGDSMKTRFRFYFEKYRATKKEAEAPGFGITDADIRMRITTIPQKLEYLCPCFQRMDALFGDSPHLVSHMSNSQPVAYLEGDLDDQDQEDDQLELGSEDNHDGAHLIEEDVPADTLFLTNQPMDHSFDSDASIPTPPPGMAATRSGVPETNAQTPNNISPLGTRSPAQQTGIRPLPKDRAAKKVKLMTDNHHAISTAFARNLEMMVMAKEKTNKIREAKLEIEKLDLALQEKKLQWEITKHEQERQDRLSLAKHQLKMAIVNSSTHRSAEEVLQLIKEVE